VTHLSNVYRYTEQFGIVGHRIGRKVGDMLEVVTMACLYQDKETRTRMLTEPKVEGFTGANHKVEFAFYQAGNRSKCIGLVECKKVGVEVTTHSKTKNGPLVLGVGESIAHSMRPKWVKNPVSPSVVYDGKCKLRVNLGKETYAFDVTEKSKIKIVITEDGNYAALGPGVHLASLNLSIGACHFFNIRECTDTSISIHIDTCLTGPQTIEKAKQTAWVALDVRKKECGHWGKEDVPDQQRSFVSVLVVGEPSHWEEKSRQVVSTALDYNLFVDDLLIVSLFEAFIAKFGQTDFEPLISKDKYVNDPSVRSIVDSIVAARDGKILAELVSGEYHRIILRNDELIVEPIS
jgi:hypothetical protein